MQNIHGGTSLMSAAYQGHEACVQALLRAKADTELVDCDGHTALLWAESQGHTAITKLLRQHASCLSLGLDNITLCAGLTLDAWRLWVVLCGAISVVLGVIAVARADAAVASTSGGSAWDAQVGCKRALVWHLVTPLGFVTTM